MMCKFPIMLFIIFWSTVCSAEFSNTNLDTLWQATLADLEKINGAQKFPFDDCFESASVLHDVPKPLILAVARGESNFDPGAVSEANAYGIMQIRWPVTAQHLGIHNRLDLYDACINIDAGTRYLGELINLFDGNVHRALAAYNYGPSRISQFGAEVPTGARWYSNYIHRQLVHVLSNKSENIAKSLVTSSSMRFRAASFLAYLESEVPGARFEMHRGDSDRYQVSLLHANSVEYLHGLEGLSRIGFSLSKSGR